MIVNGHAQNDNAIFFFMFSFYFMWTHHVRQVFCFSNLPSYNGRVLFRFLHTPRTLPTLYVNEQRRETDRLGLLL